MKKRVLFVILIGILSISVQGMAQDITGTSKIDPKYLTAVEKNPDDFDAHRRAAGAYLTSGYGPEAIKHLERCIELNKEKAIEQDVYMSLAMAHYYAAEFKKSMEATQKALEINPKNEMAINFKDMLDEVAQRDFGGALPEKGSWDGYSSVGEMQEAQFLNGVGILYEVRDEVHVKETRLTFIPPKAWQKRANIPHADGSGSSHLMYLQKEGQAIPMISITTDAPGPNVRSVIDFTQFVRKEMLRMAPGVSIADPYVVKIAGRDASVFDMRDTNKNFATYWYQFLIGGNIVSIQLTTLLDQFDENLKILKEFAESMQVENYLDDLEKEINDSLPQQK